MPRQARSGQRAQAAARPCDGGPGAALTEPPRLGEARCGHEQEALLVRAREGGPAPAGRSVGWMGGWMQIHQTDPTDPTPPAAGTPARRYQDPPHRSPPHMA